MTHSLEDTVLENLAHSLFKKKKKRIWFPIIMYADFSIPLKSKYYNKISDCMTNVQNVSIYTIIIKFLSFLLSTKGSIYPTIWGKQKSFLKDAQYLGINNCMSHESPIYMTSEYIKILKPATLS